MSVTLAIHITMSCKLLIASPGDFCLGRSVSLRLIEQLFCDSGIILALAAHIPICNVSLCESGRD